MHPDLKALRRIEELELVLAESTRRPVLLFKHSHTCGISAEALDALLEHLADRDHLSDRKVDAGYAIVTVQTHRDVSTAVAQKLGIRHETPQALLIRDGRVVWSASHFRVTANAVGAALGTLPV